MMFCHKIQEQHQTVSVQQSVKFITQIIINYGGEEDGSGGGIL